MKEVVVVIGPGSIGQAIVRRVGAGRQVLLADLREENAAAAAKALGDAGFDVGTAAVDILSREAVQGLVATEPLKSRRAARRRPPSQYVSRCSRPSRFSRAPSASQSRPACMAMSRRARTTPSSIALRPQT